MKNNLKMVFALVVVIIISVSVYYQSKKPDLINEQPPITAENSILGCYVVNFNKDVYTLTILSEQSGSFEGNLRFKNFQKDSSSGTYKGTYKDGILLGDYSFQSEGMNSVMQVIFKKSGSDFIRGYGEVNMAGDRFVDVNSVTYDSSSPLAVFKTSKDGCETSL